MKRFLLVFGLMFFLTASIYADWDLKEKIWQNDGGYHTEFFGHSVAIDGDYAIVGAPYDDEDEYPDISFGAAYIYEFEGDDWVFKQKLQPSEEDKTMFQFGYSVAIDGDYAIVGANNAWIEVDDVEYHIGAAYIFKRIAGVWTEMTKLQPTDGDLEQGRYGSSVAIDGEYALIGEHYGDDDLGAAYVYKRNGEDWSQKQKLTASDAQGLQWFGYSLDIEGGHAFIGCLGSQSVYVFGLDGGNWTQKQIFDKNGGNNGEYGQSISMDGDYALVGDYYDAIYISGHWERRGAVYPYKWDGNSWVEQPRFYVSKDNDEVVQFGYSVCIDGDYALVGDNYDSENGMWTGAAYLFKRDGNIWVEQQRFIDNDGFPCDQFGWSVSISGDNFIVGAYHAKVEDVNYVGAAFTYYNSVQQITWDGSESKDWNTAAN